MNGIILLVIILLLVVFLTLLITRQWGGLFLFLLALYLMFSGYTAEKCVVVFLMVCYKVVPQKRRFPWFLQNKLNFLGNNGKMKGEQF